MIRNNKLNILKLFYSNKFVIENKVVYYNKLL